MEFKPGQKVICVRKNPWTIQSNVNVKLPKYGDKCTVSLVHGAFIHLEEVGDSACLAASEFRHADVVNDNYYVGSILVNKNHRHSHK